MESVAMATNNHADVEEVERGEEGGRAGGDKGPWRGLNLCVAEIQLC